MILKYLIHFQDGFKVSQSTSNLIEFFSSDENNQLTMVGYDDIKVIDIHRTFGESLLILSSDQLMSGNNMQTTVFSAPVDGIVVVANDKLKLIKLKLLASLLLRLHIGIKTMKPYNLIIVSQFRRMPNLFQIQK